MVFISSDTKMKIVTISPNYEILDSVSRYQVADKYHEYLLTVLGQPDLDDISAHLQSSVFKLSKDLIDSIHEEGIVAYTS